MSNTGLKTFLNFKVNIQRAETRKCYKIIFSDTRERGELQIRRTNADGGRVRPYEGAEDDLKRLSKEISLGQLKEIQGLSAEQEERIRRIISGKNYLLTLPTNTD